MKRGLLKLAAAICACCLLTGCDLWMDGSYYSVTPHLQENRPPVQTLLEVASYEELQDTLAYMVEDGRTSDLIYITGFNEQQIRGYMSTAARYITSNHAVGAYAVDEITYEIGTNSGRLAIAVEISYHHTRSEILRIKDVANMTETALVIANVLENCDASVVLRIREYDSTDFIQLVQNYVDTHPQTCMEMPQVSVSIYPDRGTERVVELIFSYQTNRDSLRDMQRKVQTVFDSAKLYVSDEADVWGKYGQLYAFLMERYDYVLETSITPSYSLLHHGVGDSKAFATVYSAICRQVGLDCQVVSGTRDGIPWHWNVLLYENTHYYVDLLRCSESNNFAVKRQGEMTGYVWDYSAH